MEAEEREQILVKGLAAVAFNPGESWSSWSARSIASETFKEAGYVYKKYPEVPPDSDGWYLDPALVPVVPLGALGESMLKSANRLAVGEGEWEKTHARLWIPFLKRESWILLKRAFKFWWRFKWM